MTTIGFPKRSRNKCTFVPQSYWLLLDLHYYPALMPTKRDSDDQWPPSWTRERGYIGRDEHNELLANRTVSGRNVPTTRETNDRRRRLQCFILQPVVSVAFAVSVLKRRLTARVAIREGEPHQVVPVEVGCLQWLLRRLVFNCKICISAYLILYSVISCAFLCFFVYIVLPSHLHLYSFIIIIFVY